MYTFFECGLDLDMKKDGKEGNMTKNNNGKTINSQASMNKAVKSICDILRRVKSSA